MATDDGLLADWRSRVKGRSSSLRAPIIVVPTLGILVSEGSLYVGFLDVALWGHFLTLLFCAFAPLVFRDEIPVAQAFALVPLFRLVNLGMPVFFELTIFWFPLIYAPLVPAVYVLGRPQPSPYRDTPDRRIRFNPKLALLSLPVVVPLAAAMAQVEYLILEPDSLIPVWNLWNVALISVVMIGFVGLVEELVFRGVLQDVLERRIGKIAGLLLASAIFGLMHSGYGLPAEVVYAGSIGLIFGIVYDWTDSIITVTVLHGLVNVFLFAVYPMQGSPVDLLL